MWASGRVVLWVDERWVIDEKLFNIHIPQSHEKKQIYNIVHAMSWGKVGMFSTPTFFSHVSRLSFTYLINFYFTRGAFTFFLEWKSPTRKIPLLIYTRKKKFSSFANCQLSLTEETKFCSNFHILLSVFEKAINFHHQRRATTTWKFSLKLFFELKINSSQIGCLSV